MNISIGLFATIFFASKAGKKIFPLLSRLGSTEYLYSSFIGVVDCAIDFLIYFINFPLFGISEQVKCVLYAKFRKTLKGFNIHSHGCNPWLQNKNGQNPTGVQHAILYINNNGSTPSGFYYAIFHSPWILPMAMNVQPLRGGKNEVVGKKKSGMSEFPTYHFCKSNKNKATLN
jgi:hypothetical protein